MGRNQKSGRAESLIKYLFYYNLFSIALKIYFNLFNTVKIENIENTFFFIKFFLGGKVTWFILIVKKKIIYFFE